MIGMDSDLKILILNGVNLDLLGRREPEVYGHFTLKDLEKNLREELPLLRTQFGVKSIHLTFHQTNDEADFLEMLNRDWEGVVINPGAWTHTSLAIADRLKGLNLQFVEVHISNIHARESIRSHSFSAPHALGVVVGFGLDSYRLGLFGLIKKIVDTRTLTARRSAAMREIEEK